MNPKLTSSGFEATLLNTQNGMRCVCHNVPDAAVDYFGVIVDCGSRDDPSGGFGLAHFVEHTLFKGTSRRKSWHIINRMEACGGELNAYTTKESTTVYSVAPKGNLSRSMDLISDLILNSCFPMRELEKEREVVIDEINSYLDMPAEAVVDDFEDLLFAGSSLGHNILGDAESVGRFDSDMCREYLKRHYFRENMVVFYSGPESPEKIVTMVERYFASIGSKSIDCKQRGVIADVDRFERERRLSIHQSHTIMGARIFDMYDSRRYAFAVLANLLGGPGMNSLLNVELREKRGLVYSVDVATSLLTDAGIFTIYFGCDQSDVGKCRGIVDRTIDMIADSPLSERKLAATLRQYVGQLTVAAENRENMVMSLGRQALYRGALTRRCEIVERIMSVTAEDLRAVAELVSSERLSTLTFC